MVEKGGERLPEEVGGYFSVVYEFFVFRLVVLLYFYGVVEDEVVRQTFLDQPKWSIPSKCSLLFLLFLLFL